MRVIEVISGLGLGGAEKALVRRLGLAPVQFKTAVLSTRPDLSQLDAEVAEHAQLLTLKVGRISGRQVLGALRAHQPDLVVAHNPLETMRLALWAPLWAKRHLVAVAHSDRITGRRGLDTLLALPMRFSNRRCRAHIAVSKAAARGAQCVGSREMHVIHLGGTVNQQATPVDIWPEGTAVRLLFLGRFVAAKNLLSLVSAIAAAAPVLRQTRASVALVGYGPLQEQLQSQIDDLGIADLVAIHAPVSEPSSLLLGADAVLIASKYEGGPLTVYEALIAGCRVMATPVGVVPEVLAVDEDSLILRDAEIPTLAQGLSEVCRRGSMTQEHRRQRQVAAARWTAETCASEWYRVMQSLMPRSGTSGFTSPSTP